MATLNIPSIGNGLAAIGRSVAPGGAPPPSLASGTWSPHTLPQVQAQAAAAKEWDAAAPVLGGLAGFFFGLLGGVALLKAIR